MWVFTTSGFVSAVYKDGAIQVRARDRKSLELLVKATGAEVVATPLADYPYRIAITNEQFAGWITQQALDIDYKNFKSEVADTRGYGFAKPLNQVWSVMHDVEDSKARVRG
jgi:UDP-3-O-acyl-N-acetylglucosamine deacetylase